MAEVQFPKGSENAMMITDLVRLFQAFWKPDDNKEYWDKVFVGMTDYIKKYTKHDNLFVECMTDAFTDYLDLKSNAKDRKVGDVFKCKGREYEVLDNGNARFVRSK